jgi:streptogramin lyase
MKRRLAGVAILGVAVWLLVQVIGSALGPHVTAALHVGSSPYDAAVDQTGNLWVIGRDDGTLWRIDAATNKVEEGVPLSVAGGADPVSIAFGEGSLWVGTNWPCEIGQSAFGCLLRIDPGSGKQLAAIPIGIAPSVAVGAGAVWVTSPGKNTLARIDPSSNRVVATIPDVCRCSVAADDSAVWVAGPGSVLRIDPLTNRVVAEVGLGGYPNWPEVAIGAGAVWVAYYGMESEGPFRYSEHLVRIDPATNRIVADIPVRGANGLAVGVDSVWIATGQSVVRVDARSNAVVSEVTVGLADGVAVNGHTVWVWSATGRDTVWRIAY